MDSSTPSSDPFHGLNPADLMAAAAMPTDGGADTLPLAPRDLPTLAEIAAAFPDLEILDLIGHGGMSAVFRARQPKLDRVVALKVLPKSLAATPGFAERFTREGRVLARLSHPNIVTVHDFGESGGFCYLIMEYVDGVNLRQAMRAGRFTPEQALNIIPVMCEALQYAHSQGVLHRDIKPENILLDTKGRVKIADFGIAKILDENGDGGMMLTQSGAKLGTAPYMAPEQIEQPGSVDHRADIYSLGVVFYEMLTGELPLGRFAAPSEKSAVNGNMDEVVFRALAKDRAMRQQSAGEFKTQIEGIASMPSQMRRSLAMKFSSFEYKSKRTLLGRPLLHVTSGIDPTTGRKRTARGFFAFGDRAVGVFAFGGYARGFFACGGMAVGVFALGGMSIGLISWGGLALALLLAYGGLSVGFLSAGGLALGWEAAGGLAAGVHAYGGQVYALVSGYGGEVHAPQVLKNHMEAPPMLLWLVWVTDQSALLGSWIWLPMMLPSLLMPWWARRQLEFEAQGGAQRVTSWYERPSRVLWLLPAVLLLLLALGCMTQHWSHAGKFGVNAQAFIASAIELVGFILAAISLPLWLRLVPMNSFYGVRLPSTFVSDERWYEVNAVFGKQLFCWSLAVIAAGIAGFYQLPRHQDAYSWAAVTLTLVAVAASVASTLVWMHRHPIGGPVIKPHRLLRNIEQLLPALVLGYFIKAFICASYSIPHGNEPGVAKGSLWLASRLDTGFAAGDLIAYEHESGHAWLARVIAVEPKGLQLKRGGSPEEFIMPWDKIIGKMMFSYWSPGVVKAGADAAPKATVSAPQPMDHGSATSIDQQPELVCTRIKLNKTFWSGDCYSAAGLLLDDPLGQKSDAPPNLCGSDALSDVGETCWMQLWFRHPDFDRRSEMKLTVTGLDGKPLPRERETMISGPGFSSEPGTSVTTKSIVFSPGIKGRLPEAVRVVLSYCIGPRKVSTRIRSGFSGGMHFGDGALFSNLGESQQKQAFISWSTVGEKQRFFAVAHKKDGSWVESCASGLSGSTTSEGIPHFSADAKFPLRLDEIEEFGIGHRPVRTVIFERVVIPPLPTDGVAGVTVSGDVMNPSRIAWHDGLTIRDAVMAAGGVAPSVAPDKCKLLHEGMAFSLSGFTSFEQIQELDLQPGDQIIIFK
jgi:tRNA A-37 threonylcarbamoyl transferase component Bud32